MIEARCNIKRGEEICLDYGANSNQVYFLLYGFVNSNNELDDDLPFQLKLDTEDPNYQAKLDLLTTKADELQMFRPRGYLNHEKMEGIL